MNFSRTFIISITLIISACSNQVVQNDKTSTLDNKTIANSLTARSILIADDAFSGSSVNVLAGVKQTVFTDSIYQYVAFYNADAQLVLAKRRLGEDIWQKQVTEFSANVNDAHNHISLIVDGAGYLHIAWDHHNNSLRYARSKIPGSLQLEKLTMLSTKAQVSSNEDPMQEGSVTYPQFYRLKNGDLLFAYRHGGSGQGALVLNNYNVEAKKWQRVHNSLLDGEGKRSAYWDMSIDVNGVLHLAWIWRETPDVASNHDLAYAQSFDSGKTWQTIDGDVYQMPINKKRSDVIKYIAENHKLMNPPVVAADKHSNPFIASYWAETPTDKPRYHVMFVQQDNTSDKPANWQEIKAPKVAINFKLSGKGTKNPPISRAALLVESDWHNSWFHLIYRDDFQGGNVIASTIKDLDKPVWQHRVLVNDDMGAWEPSIDISQWNRLKQVHLLLQKVGQKDGNDEQSLALAPSDIRLLIWSPNWEYHQELSPVPSVKENIDLTKALDKQTILAMSEQMANWQWQHINEKTTGHYHPRGWVYAPFYMGNLAIAKLLPNSGLEARMIARGDELNWQPHKSLYDADDHAVIQPYLNLYLKYQDKRMLSASQIRFDKILATPSNSSLDWGNPDSRHRWTWSDSLFMGPHAWMLMYKATGDKKYFDFMHQEWQAMTARLYRPEIGLYFRDESYLDVRERNGSTLHWARGTGWSIAGLARILSEFPKDNEHYPTYVKQFKEMSSAFKNAQQSDGLWRPGLLDPNTHTAKESSGSAFAVFAMAWGVNNDLLDRKNYLPAIIKGWHALANCVTPTGKLENVQPIGAAPHGFDPKNSEAFAVGAFLLAASEVALLAK
ncbi:MAG: BNR-4 repeat-containing protein [Colwellia sp.]